MLSDDVNPTDLAGIITCTLNIFIAAHSRDMTREGVAISTFNHDVISWHAFNASVRVALPHDTFAW